jgi:hypothetical protein
VTKLRLEEALRRSDQLRALNPHDTATYLLALIQRIRVYLFLFQTRMTHVECCQTRSLYYVRVAIQ